MALIKCKECGKEISDQAERCPNCGVKNQLKIKENELHKNIKTGSILCIIGSALIIAWSLLAIVDGIFNLSNTTNNTNNTETSSGYTINIKLNGGIEEEKINYEYYSTILILSSIIMLLAILCIKNDTNKIKLLGIALLVLSIIVTVMMMFLNCCQIFLIIAPLLCFVGSILILIGSSKIKNDEKL